MHTIYSADMPANNINITALISSGLTFLLTFIFTFVVGCVCGICFSKMCKKPKVDASQPQHPMPVYDTVHVLSKDMENTVAVELKQNVSYAPVSMN